MNFLADLHIHTALSPCAADEMTPPAIVAAALKKKMDMIAICDHNSAGNAKATQQAATHLHSNSAGAAKRLTVLAGIEITTAEEAHVLGIFPDAAAAEACGATVLATLPDVPASLPRDDCRQNLLDWRGRVVGSQGKWLSAASTLALEAAIRLIKSHGGLAIAAHVDRHALSVMSQLGFFPAGAGFDAVEIVAQAASSRLQAAGSRFANLPAVFSSDSHFLDDVASRYTEFPDDGGAPAATGDLPAVQANFTFLKSCLQKGARA